MINNHTFLAKLIHWTFIPLYGYGIFKQVDDLSQLEDPSLLNFEILFATVFLVIVLSEVSSRYINDITSGIIFAILPILLFISGYVFLILKLREEND